MPLTKPYPHIYRHGPEKVITPFYELRSSSEIQHFLASYEILKRDLRRVFEFVEPNAWNNATFSHRIFELLLRACTEVEALCRLVFSKNHVTIERNANMIRFSDLEGPMRLSQYDISCVDIDHPAIKPFESFANPKRDCRSPPWYRAYNDAKHNRLENFSEASLENLIQGMSAVFTLLIAQVGPFFDDRLQIWHGGAGFRAVHDLFCQQVLPNWSVDEQYDFDWNQLKSDSQPFQHHAIPQRP
jgi:hypothetical protein